MSLRNYFVPGTFALALLCLPISAVAQEGSTLEPPRVQLVDRNHVNMVSGSLNLSLTDLHIGTDALGLTHTISSYGGYFHGFSETYMGSLYTAYINVDLSGNKRPVKRVNTGESITDFEISGNNYTPLGNPQDRLVKSGDTHIYTSSNGTEYRYTPAGPSVADLLREIKYPNGYTVTVHRGMNASGKVYRGVTTNTGLQFKQIFNEQHGSSWSRTMPDHILAINNAVEYCSPTASDCNLSHDWPKVTYKWTPGPMPNALSMTPVVFRVTDAIGRVTEYHHEPFDRFAGSAGPEGQHFVPRVIRIKDAISNSGVSSIDYEYENVIGWRQVNSNYAYKTVLEEAVIKTARVQNENWRYSVSNQSPTGYGGTEVMKTTNGYGAIKQVRVHQIRSVPAQIVTDNETIDLRSTYDNRVTSISYPEGNRLVFQYDSRGRLTSRTLRSGVNSGPGDIEMKAEYPSGCPNRKTCNKPTRVEDAMGNPTDYTYHGSSGQVATVTGPPDRNGVRPQTRYSYEQYYAWFKDSNDNIQRANSPIWLLAKESSCRTSAATSSGCQGGAADEGVIEYEYGPEGEPNNLFLRGMAVIADGQIRRTCYQYDPYGNVIGEIQPKAGLNECI